MEKRKPNAIMKWNPTLEFCQFVWIFEQVNKEMNEPAHLNQAQGQRGVSRDGNGYMEPDTRWTLFY